MHQGRHHQRWNVLDSVRDEGSAVLQAVATTAKLNGWWAALPVPLYSIGSSQGGTNACAFHMWWQRKGGVAAELLAAYSLRETFACSGMLCGDVLAQSMLTSYAGYARSGAVQASVAAPLLPASKKMQHILLAHLLYTYQNEGDLRAGAGAAVVAETAAAAAAGGGPGPPGIEWAAGSAPDPASPGDDFRFMAAIIKGILPDNQAVAHAPRSITGYAAPPFLTARCWATVHDPASTVHQELLGFLRGEVSCADR